MIDIIAAFFMIAGSLFIFLASIGMIKFPDIYMRMSATTKSATLGVGLVLLATAIFFNEVGVITRAITIILFLFLTAPVAAHMIGRASYFDGQPLWEKSIADEMKECIDMNTHKIDSERFTKQEDNEIEPN